MMSSWNSGLNNTLASLAVSGIGFQGSNNGMGGQESFVCFFPPSGVCFQMLCKCFRCHKTFESA